ncbi:MAG: hypothetical protein COT15_04775 [Candidatus Diapherotrites archaeon CG08_land_8_20_14_0_20_34_12]|nr:MAG: hypothetical protein COT15_04775 [Candidatus Diapherotrites archaeon CG08_land_8_20_14_0_20_34_12]
MFSLSVKLLFTEKDFANKVAKLLKVDNDHKQFRSKSKIDLKNNLLLIKISAADLTAIRAAINFYLKSIILIEELKSL